MMNWLRQLDESDKYMHEQFPWIWIVEAIVLFLAVFIGIQIAT